ncbi:hypothetical protein Tco_0542403 [Tanacetum coccineum]
MPNTRSGASMTHEEIEDFVSRRVAEEIEAREAAMNLEPLNESGDEQEGENEETEMEGMEEMEIEKIGMEMEEGTKMETTMGIMA